MVNTLELRGIETYSPEIQTFLREIEKSFNNCVPADQQEKEAIQLRNTVEGIGNCLEMHCAPGEVFECFSCGTFKEAYHASNSIVVKFCSTNNETKREQALLAAAEEADILELFVPTFFHRLPVNHPTRYTYNYHYHTWCKDPSVDDFELNYLEIQPMVNVAYENIVWDEQGEVIPRLSCGVFLRVISLG